MLTNDVIRGAVKADRQIVLTGYDWPRIRFTVSLGIYAIALGSFTVLVNILSYARIPAVLLAKGGMAFVVNLLVFGAYIAEDGASHFMHNTAVGAIHGEMIFPGLIHPASFGIAGLIGGIITCIYIQISRFTVWF